MDISVGNVTTKVNEHGTALAMFLGMYGHEKEYGGGIGTLIQYLQGDLKGNHGPLYELKYELENPDWYFSKLLDSGHLYSTLFKAGALAWGLGFFGIYKKYESLGAKFMKGSAFAAAVMQGSGPSDNGSASQGASGIRGF